MEANNFVSISAEDWESIDANNYATLPGDLYKTGLFDTSTGETSLLNAQYSTEPGRRYETSPNLTAATDLWTAKSSNDLPPQFSKGHLFFALGCFFFTGVSCLAGWTALNAWIQPLKRAYGRNILVLLSAAYYGPAIPVLMAHAMWIEKHERKFGTLKMFGTRILACLGMMAVGMIVTIWNYNHPTKLYFILLAVWLGIFGGLCFGSLFQFVSLFPPKCNAVFSMGQYAVGFFMLAIQLSLQLRDNPSPDQAVIYWVYCALMVVLGMIGFSCLLSTEVARFYCDLSDRAYRAQLHQTKAQQPSYRSIWNHVWLCALSIYLSILSTITLVSFFPYVSSSTGSTTLQAALFYTKTGGDFSGRCMTFFSRLIPGSNKRLIALASIRFLCFPLFCVYTFTTIIPHNDTVLLIFIALASVLGGFVNTCSYIRCRQTLKANERTRGAHLINLSFQSGVYLSIAVGIVASVVIEKT